MASFNYPVIADNVGGLASLNSKRAPALFSDPSFVRVPSTTLRPVVRNLPTNSRPQTIPQQQNVGNISDRIEADRQSNSHPGQNGIISMVEPTAAAAVVSPQQSKEHFGFIKNHPYLAGIVFLLLCMFAIVGYFYYKHNGETDQKCKKGDVSDIASGVAVPATASAKSGSNSAPAQGAVLSSVAGLAASGVATKPTVTNSNIRAQNMASGGTELFAGASSEISNSTSAASSPADHVSMAQAPAPPPYTQEQLQQFMLLVKSNPQMLSAYRRQMQLILQVQRQQLLEQYKQAQVAPKLGV
jgi:hypothetical protein